MVPTQNFSRNELGCREVELDSYGRVVCQSGSSSAESAKLGSSSKKPVNQVYQVSERKLSLQHSHLSPKRKKRTPAKVKALKGESLSPSNSSEPVQHLTSQQRYN